jgi:mono/diheme cytochrome c family protein
MEISPNVRSCAAAVFVAGCALMSAFAFGATLRRSAAVHSHQRPIGEQWFETPTPTSPKLVTQGRKLFLDNCAHCHGADALGDEGPDLHGVQVSDRYISNIITRGIPHEMPSFKKKLGAPDITALTAYVRSLDEQ